MKRVLALTSAGLLATSMLAFPVLAQDDDDAGGSASASSSASSEASSNASFDSGMDGVSGSAEASAAAEAEAEAEASGGLTEAEDDGAEEAAPTEAVEAEDEGATEGAPEAAETEVAPEEEEEEMETATTSSDVEQVAVVIESSNTFITQIANVGEGATVHVANIGIVNNFEIENTIEVHADDIANLQNAIASNGTLVSALEAEDVSVSSIVGASADGDQLTLFKMECDDAAQLPVCS